MRHTSFKSLRIIDKQGNSSFRLSCPALQDLTLQVSEFPTALLQSMTSMCPTLKNLHLLEEAYIEEKVEGSNEHDGNEGVEALEERPREIFHETLEVLKLECKVWGQSPIRIICPSVNKVCLSNESFWERVPDSLNCPKVATLKLVCCPDLSRIPSILSKFPLLKLLEISEFEDESMGVEGEQCHIDGLVIKKEKMWPSIPNLLQYLERG